MAIVTFNFISGIIYSLLFMCSCGSVWTRKSKYQPYGPKMCNRLCENSDSNSSYLYTVEDLSCHWLLVGNSSRYGSRPLKQSSCPKTNNLSDGRTTLPIISGWDICKKEYKGPSVSQTTLPSKISCSRDLQLVQYNRDLMLYWTSRQGELGMVKFILSHGIADINCRVGMGRTPVMAAAFSGHKSVFDFLMSKGCDLTASDDHKDKVIHNACRGGNIDIVRELIVRYKCNIEDEGFSSRTPVMMAAYYGHREVFDLLMKRKCKLKSVDKHKHNLLHFACSGGHVNMVKYILALNVFGIESKDHYGATPVILAAQGGHIEVVDLLMRRGCDVGAVDGRDNNILHKACINNKLNMVEYIVSKNIVDRDGKGSFGRTPVMLAAGRGYIKIVDFLLSKGCNLTAVDNQGNNILHLVCMHGNVDHVKYILRLNVVGIDSRGPNMTTPAMTAVCGGHREVLDLLMENGCNLKTVDKHGRNILHLACLKGKMDMIKYLITLKVVKEMENAKDSYGKTPALMAGVKGRRSLKALLKRNK